MAKCSKCGHTKGGSNCKCGSSSGHRSSSSETSDKSKGSHHSSKSHQSGKSSKSHDSNKTASSGASELTTLAQTISEDIEGASEVLDSLTHNWNADQETYDTFVQPPDVHWTRTMRDESKTYKEYDAKQKQDIEAFKKYYNTYCRSDQEPTIENFKELRRLAFKWADDATTAAEARTQFLINYPNAYPDQKAVKGHIDRAKILLKSAEKALARQKKTRSNIKAMKAE